MGAMIAVRRSFRLLDSVYSIKWLVVSIQPFDTMFLILGLVQEATRGPTISTIIDVHNSAQPQYSVCDVHKALRIKLGSDCDSSDSCRSSIANLTGSTNTVGPSQTQMLCQRIQTSPKSDHSTQLLGLENYVEGTQEIPNAIIEDILSDSKTTSTNLERSQTQSTKTPP